MACAAKQTSWAWLPLSVEVHYLSTGRGVQSKQKGSIVLCDGNHNTIAEVASARFALARVRAWVKLAVCWPYAGRVLAVCQPCADCVLAVCWPCAGRVLTVCGPCAGRVLTVCGPCAGRVLAVCWPCAGRVRNVC